MEQSGPRWNEREQGVQIGGVLGAPKCQRQGLVKIWCSTYSTRLDFITFLGISKPAWCIKDGIEWHTVMRYNTIIRI